MNDTVPAKGVLFFIGLSSLPGRWLAEIIIGLEVVVVVVVVSAVAIWTYIRRRQRTQNEESLRKDKGTIRCSQQRHTVGDVIYDEIDDRKAPLQQTNSSTMSNVYCAMTKDATHEEPDTEMSADTIYDDAATPRALNTDTTTLTICDSATPDVKNADTLYTNVATPDVMNADTLHTNAATQDVMNADTLYTDAATPDVMNADTLYTNAATPDVMNADTFYTNAATPDVMNADTLYTDAATPDAMNADTLYTDAGTPHALNTDTTTLTSDSLLDDNTGYINVASSEPTMTLDPASESLYSNLREEGNVPREHSRTAQQLSEDWARAQSLFINDALEEEIGF